MKEHRWWLLVLALFLARFACSLRGLDYGLPETHEPDVELVRQSLHFRGEVEAKPEQLAVYPHLISRLMAWMPRSESAPPLHDSPSLEAHLAFASRHFYAARLCVALLAGLTIPLTWVLARRFLAPPWALFATALMATSLLHFDYSQQARPHGPLTTFVLAATLAAMALVERPNLVRHTLAGICAALAVGALHSGTMVLPGGLVALLLARRSHPSAAPRYSFIPVLFVAGSFAIFYPFLFSDIGAILGDANPPDTDPSDFPHKVRSWDGHGFALLWSFFWDYDPLLWGLTLLGVLSWLLRTLKDPRAERARWRPADLVVFATLLPYLLVLGAYSQIFVRFLEPVLPFAAVAASAFVAKVSLCLLRPRTRKWLSFATALLLLAFPSYLLLRLGALRSLPDTLSECASWIQSDPKRLRARVLITPTLSLPLFHAVVRREEYEPWSSPASHFWHRYLCDLPVEQLDEEVLDLRYISRGGYPYMSFKDYPKNETKARQYIQNLKGQIAIVSQGGAMLDGVRLAVSEKGVLLHRISPWKDGQQDTPLGLTERGDDFWTKILRARTLGPLLEIYRLGDKN